MTDIPSFDDLIKDDQFRFSDDINMERIHQLNRAITDLFIKRGDEITPSHAQLSHTPEQRDIIVERIRQYIQNFNQRELCYYIYIGKMSFIQRVALYVQIVEKMTEDPENGDPTDGWPEP